jgi:hypothetical protein
VKLRTLVGGVVAGALCLALSGCIETEADFDVNNDATVDGLMTVEMSTELAGMFGITSREAFEKQLLDPESSEIPAGQSFTVKEEDGKYKMEITYDNTPLVDDDMKLEVTSDDQIKFTYRNSGMNSDTGMGDVEGMQGSIKFTLQFPGAIDKTTPTNLPESVEIDGNVLRITSDLTENLDLEVYAARGDSAGSGAADNDDNGQMSITALDQGGDDSSNTVAILIAIAAAALALVAVAYVVVRRRTRGLPE